MFNNLYFVLLRFTKIQYTEFWITSYNLYFFSSSNMRTCIVFYLLFVALLYTGRCSEILQEQSLAVTIYNDNFAMVKDTRLISFDQGESFLYFTDVAENIQTPTVTFKALKNPKSIRVYEQNFQKNLINTNTILQKYIQKNITIFAQFGQQARKLSGQLLGYNSGYIIKNQQGIQQFNKIAGLQLPSLPDGFFTRPTLSWKVWSQTEQQSSCEVAYRTTGFRWSADYSITVNKQETKADLGGWVTIDNNSGKKYQNAKLKLIAGDVNVVRQPVPSPRPVILKSKSVAAASQQKFVQKSFADYHMYTLSRPVTLNISSQKQVQFVPKVYDIPIQKFHQIRISAGGSPEPQLQANNKIRFTNSEKYQLGIPFPKGTVRVFKSDEDDGSLEFIGQDSINHTPKDENITVLTGKAFDIVAQKIQKSWVSVNNMGGYSAELVMKVTNRKETPVDVVVIFNNYYADNLRLKMVKGQQPERVSASQFRWRKILKPDEQWQFSWKQDK